MGPDPLPVAMSQAKRKRGSLGEQTSAKQAKQEDGIGASAFDELRGLVDTIQRQKKEGASAADTDKEALHCTPPLRCFLAALEPATSRLVGESSLLLHWRVPAAVQARCSCWR